MPLLQTGAITLHSVLHLLFQRFDFSLFFRRNPNPESGSWVQILGGMRRPVRHGPHVYDKAHVVSKSRNNVPKKKKSAENSSRALISNASFFYVAEHRKTRTSLFNRNFIYVALCCKERCIYLFIFLRFVILILPVVFRILVRDHDLILLIFNILLFFIPPAFKN